MVVGGLSYIFSSHWTFGYMMGGFATFVVGISFSVYYLAVKLELMDYFTPEHHTSPKEKKRSAKHEEVGRASGTWS